MNNQQSKKGIIIIVGIIIVVIVILLAYFLMKPKSNDNESNNDNHQSNNDTVTLYKTVSAKELSENEDNKEYRNKKIKITDLIVTKDTKGELYIKGEEFLSFFFIECENLSSLNIKEGDQISVTGLVEDSDITTDTVFHIKNCVVE